VNENVPSIEVRALAPADAEALLALRQRNRAYFAPSEPLRDDAWFTIERQRAAIMADAEACARGDALVFGVFADGPLVGRVALTGIVRGPFLNAYLSYAVDRDYVNRGIATLAVTEVVRRAWLQGLHRVQAAVSPHNFASKRVLRKAGFRREGLAKRYLRLGGEWADQELWAITVEDDPCAQNVE
jgi:[ribosomal protein S5]-alanine N-acetyltransferase